MSFIRFNAETDYLPSYKGYTMKKGDRLLLIPPPHSQQLFDILINIIKESIMQVALNLGTININDKEVVKFIQNKSIDEIKSMIVELLKSQVKTDTPKKSKGKWGAFAERMSGLTTPEITEHIHTTSLEMRDGFKFRELNSK